MARGFAALEKVGPLEAAGKTEEAIALYKVRPLYTCMNQYDQSDWVRSTRGKYHIPGTAVPGIMQGT